MTIGGLTLDPRMVWLFGGVAGLLLVASLIGFVLSKTVKTESGRDTVRNLNARIKAWWGMVAVFAVAFAFGKGVTLVLFALDLLLLPARVHLADPDAAVRSPRHRRRLLPLHPAAILADLGRTGCRCSPSSFRSMPSCCCRCSPSLRGETEDFLLRTAKIQWGLMLTVFCISHAPALLILNIPGYQNVYLLFFLVTVVQLTDVLQYVFGKLFGRHKIAPNVSPSKTVEGFVGGGLAATAIGAGLYWITPFTPLAAAGMALVIVLAGFFGGLVLSAVKRSLGAKDWGTMIEGHGGALDRMDSVTFAAPLFFHLVNYFYTV